VNFIYVFKKLKHKKLKHKSIATLVEKD